MPTTPQSPAQRKVTDTVALFEAAEMAVMFAGDKCALEFYTRGGISKVTLPLRVFLARARGRADANGNPFPEAAPLERAEQIERELAADVAPQPDASAEEAPAVVAEPRRRKALLPEEAAKFRLIEQQHGEKRGTFAQLCAFHGVERRRFDNWRYYYGSRLPSAGGSAPVLKPNGRLL